jgi:VRR-NUC domain
VTFLPVVPRMSERTWMAAVIKLAAVLQWKVYHTHRSDKSTPGFPDLVLVRRPRIVWLELKSERGKATTDQLWWIGELRACGQEVYVARPSDADKLTRVLR